MLLVLALGAEGSPGWRTALEEDREKGSRDGVSFFGGGEGRGREGRAAVSLELQRTHLKLWGSWVAAFCIYLLTHLGSLGLKNLIAIEMKPCELMIQV